ncbi:TPA: hypothetical protein ACH3X3_005355 [Trebouxia sp. C0006]
MFNAGHKFDIVDLWQHCERILKAYISHETCLQVANLAMDCHSSLLTQACAAFLESLETEEDGHALAQELHAVLFPPELPPDQCPSHPIKWVSHPIDCCSSYPLLDDWDEDDYDSSLEDEEASLTEVEHVTYQPAHIDADVKGLTLSANGGTGAHQGAEGARVGVGACGDRGLQSCHIALQGTPEPGNAHRPSRPHCAPSGSLALPSLARPTATWQLQPTGHKALALAWAAAGGKAIGLHLHAVADAGRLRNLQLLCQLPILLLFERGLCRSQQVTAGISGHLLAEDAALRTPHALAYSALSLLMLETPEMSAGIMGNAEWPLQHQQRQCRVRRSIRSAGDPSSPSLRPDALKAHAQAGTTSNSSSKQPPGSFIVSAQATFTRQQTLPSFSRQLCSNEKWSTGQT